MCRELTKLYEELIRGSLVEVAEALSISAAAAVTEEEESATEESPETSLLVRVIYSILPIKYYYYCVGDVCCYACMPTVVC